MNLLIYCSGGFGREVYDLAQRINHFKKKWETIEFIDDVRDEDYYYDTRVSSFDDIKQKYKPQDVEYIIANGEPEYREALYNKIIDGGYKLTTLIDPTAIISLTAIVEAGSIIGCNTFISSQVKIKKNSVIQQNVVIGHDAVVEPHTILSAGSFLGGWATIGRKSYIGPNVSIKDRINVGSNDILGMGSIVFKDIPDGVIALGNPARVMKKNEEMLVFK